MPTRAGRWRRGAGALVISLAVVAAVTAGYIGLRHDAASGDGGGPAARTGAAMAYDPSTGDVVMFGGSGADGQALADTWLWDGSAWSEAAPADSPPARYGAQMAWDPQSRRVILLGGTAGNGCSIGSGSSGTVTGSSGSVSAAGGCNQLQDAWAWDGSDWTQLALGQGTGQLGRYTLAGASMATDPTTGNLVLVTADSAASSPVPLPIAYDSGAASAAAPPTSSAGAVSGGAAGATGSGAGGVCIGVGGGPCGSPVALPSATPGTSPPETACPLDTGCVTSICPVTPVAQSTIACPISCSTAMIACPICPIAASSAPGVTGSAVTCAVCPVTASPDPGGVTPPIASWCGICPGACPVRAATLTWVFDGNTFQLTDSSAGDSPATGGQLTWFPAAGLLIDLGADLDAVGGGPAIPCPSGAPCPLIPAADDWQWTGSGWTLVQDLPASAAAAYFETAPVGDTAAGDVVGLDAAGATWTSTDPESGWVNASPATSPSPRSGFALAYDGSTGQVVLFGGDLLGSTAAAGEVLGDTWTWDGSTWTEQASGAATPAPSSTPSPSGSVEPVPSGVDVPPMPPAASPAVSASSATSSSAGAAS